jgi:hypothetical protein
MRRNERRKVDEGGRVATRSASTNYVNLAAVLDIPPHWSTGPENGLLQQTLVTPPFRETTQLSHHQKQLFPAHFTAFTSRYLDQGNGTMRLANTLIH